MRYIKKQIADHLKSVSVLNSKKILLQNHLMQCTERATSGGDFTTIKNRGRNRVFHRFLAANRPEQ